MNDAHLLDVRSLHLPFRVGATSYIIEADLLPNARFLAQYVQDMQLVLFDLPGGPSNLPTPAAVEALAAWGAAHDLTYTVHLPADLRLRDEHGAPAQALRQAEAVIDLTRPLAPWAWVGHLDGRSVRKATPGSAALAAWQADTAQAVRQVCAWAGDPARLAVENLEGYPPGFVDPVVTQTAAARCVDVGHLWLDGVDPLPHLDATQDRLRVVHLHGVHERDHATLAHVPTAQLDAVLRWLLSASFTGVLCLEVFGLDDLRTSLAALAAAVNRIRRQLPSVPSVRRSNLWLPPSVDGQP